MHKDAGMQFLFESNIMSNNCGWFVAGYIPDKLGTIRDPWAVFGIDETS